MRLPPSPALSRARARLSLLRRASTHGTRPPRARARECECVCVYTRRRQVRQHRDGQSRNAPSSLPPPLPPSPPSPPSSSCGNVDAVDDQRGRRLRSRLCAPFRVHLLTWLRVRSTTRTFVVGSAMPSRARRVGRDSVVTRRVAVRDGSATRRHRGGVSAFAATRSCRTVSASSPPPRAHSSRSASARCRARLRCVAPQPLRARTASSKRSAPPQTFFVRACPLLCARLLLCASAFSTTMRSKQVLHDCN